MILFGSTIHETKEVLFGKKGKGSKPNKNKELIIARMIISLLLLGTAIYFIVSGIANDIGHIMIGSIIGYWLK